MADSRHNKYVSVTDWFKPAPGSTTSGTVSGSTGTATSGASFIGGSWGSGGSGGGLTITIIKTNDTTPESNSNVYSALRVHNNFIAKDKDERTEGKLSSDVGFEVGKFVSGTSGALMYVDPDTLQTTAELDRLYVRIKAYFETLEIINVNSIGGKQIISPAGSIKCTNVAEHGGTIDIQKERQAIDENGNPLYDIDGNPIMETYIESVDNGVPEDTYRCYFLAEQDGEKVENRFKIGDQAYCQMFNAKPGISNKISNKYYWRLVTGVGDDYIDLSVSDCDTDSDAPSIGDIICQKGHRTTPDNKEGVDRQNILEFSAVDSFSPSITLYQGIGEYDPDNGKYPYSETGKDIISYGVNQLNNRAFMNVYGDVYIGDREKESFIQFDNVGGLTVKGNIQFGSKSKMDGDDMTLEERIQQAAKAYEEDVNLFKAAVEQSFLEVQDLIDGAIETYFLDPIPTLENEPAIDWTTDQIKNAHIGDLYYSGEGKAYRFLYSTDTGYYWNLITDTDITLALANAQKAQDTADSKRKIFVKQPSTNDSYEAGDMWANATYPTTGTPKYSNDLLRAITSKTAGQPFSIDHWVLASKYTDDTAAIAALLAADAAQQAADNAQSDATNAANRLNSWAADDVISPTEKQGIKEEYVRVIKDKDNIHAQWDEYFLDTTDASDIGKIYIAYNAAYLPYVEQLIYLFTAKDDKGNTIENVPIPDDFDDNQTAYYEKRTAALNTIAIAAKKVADDAQAAADNALKEAEEALTAAEAAQDAVYEVNLAVIGLRDFTDEAFLDGVINGSERKTIENYIYQINTVLAQVQQSYNEVIDNTFLIDSVAKTNLTNSYTDFVTATNELIANIDDISKQSAVSNIDRATFEVKYTNFNSKYSDYTKYLNAAIKFIEYAINSKVDDTITALGGYSYLKDALDNEKTTVTGGLVLTTLLALGYTDENKEYIVNAGINGNSPKSNDIVIWAGGSNIDKLLEPNNPKAADFLVRGDGTGYAAGGNFWWESDGTIHADPLSFVISENSVGALLSSFQVVYNVENGKPQPTYITPKVPFTTITVASDINLNNNAKISFGDVYMSYDNANNAIYFANTKGQVVNFYTSGSISMLSGTDLNVPSIFKDIPIDNQTIYWENGVLKAAGGGGGGIADSVAWTNITGKPNFAAVATSGSYSDLIGKPTLLSSFTNDLGFITSSALSDYLPKAGGTLSNSGFGGALTINRAQYNNDSIIRFTNDSDGELGYIGMQGSHAGIKPLYVDKTGNRYFIYHSGNFNPSDYLPKSGGTLSGKLNINGQFCLNSCFLLSATDGNWKVTDKDWQNEYKLWHTGNFTPSDYLPKSGGIITAAEEPLTIHRDVVGSASYIIYKNRDEELGRLGFFGGLNMNPYEPFFTDKNGNNRIILHSSNYSSYALPLSGGTIKGVLKINGDNKYNIPLVIETPSMGDWGFIQFHTGAKVLGHIGMAGVDTPVFRSASGTNNTLIHSGNYSSYALPINGGLMGGAIQWGLASSPVSINTSSGYLSFDSKGSEICVAGGNDDSLYINYRKSYHGYAPSKWYLYNGSAGSYANFYAGNIYSNSHLVLNTNNFNTYVPKLNGTGATGTWGISISGNAATASDADKVDGYHAASIFTYEGETYVNGESSLWNSLGTKGYANALPDGLTNVYNYGQTISFGVGNAKFDMYVSHVASDPYYDGTVGGIYVRSGWQSDRLHWRRLAFMDGNVASATKLKTARTIWGQSFDGTGNITGNLTLGNDVFIIVTSTGGSTNSALFLDGGNNLRLAQGTAAAGYNTYLSGNNIYFTYGTSRTTGMYLNSSGNVGIGTTNPAYKLDVNGFARALQFQMDDSNSSNSTPQSYWAIYGWDKRLSFTTRNASNTWTSEPLCILYDTGNVGIGTTDPKHKLHVEGNARINGPIYGATCVVSNDTDGYFVGNRKDGMGSSDGGLMLYTYGNTPISIFTGGVERMYIKSDGNIGIGTSNPYYKLDVSGAIYASSDIFSYYSFISNAGREGCTFHGTGISWHNSSNSWTKDLFTYSNDNDRLTAHKALNCLSTLSVSGATTLSSTLSVTGVTTFGSSIDVTGNSTFSGSITGNTFYGTAFCTTLTDYWSDGTNTHPWYGYDHRYGNAGVFSTTITDYFGMTLRTASGYICMTSGGNVGIGTTTPSAKLHVAGNILCTGSITMNSMRSMKNIVDERGLSLSELGRIKPTRFRWKDGRDDRLHIGGIADDVMNILPEVVFKGSDGVLSMDYGCAAFAIGASLIKPVSEHERRIAALERENALLKEEIRNLKSA